MIRKELHQLGITQGFIYPDIEHQSRGLFTVPVVLLFMNGKEMHRQAGILDIKELEYRMRQLQGVFCENDGNIGEIRHQ